MTNEEHERAAEVAEAVVEGRHFLTVESFSHPIRRDESAVPWDEVPEQNKMLMIAVAREILDG